MFSPKKVVAIRENLLVLWGGGLRCSWLKWFAKVCEGKVDVIPRQLESEHNPGKFKGERRKTVMLVMENYCSNFNGQVA